MPRFENAGLTVLEVSDVHALTGYTATPSAPVNVVRLTADGYGPPAFAHPAVVVRPTWIHWTCPARQGSADVLGRQSGKQRQRSRMAVAALSGLPMALHEPVDEDRLAQWFELYDGQISRMRHGRNLARAFRRDVLAPGSSHGLALWRRSGQVVCGCVVRFDAVHSALVIRFSATAAEERDSELFRAMYVTLAEVAAARGLRWLTLGNDPNFFGATLRPGLCTYKLRLGFAPVPADLFGDAGTRVVADRVVSIRGLDPPVLCFGYRRSPAPDATAEDFLTGPDALRLVAVTPDGGSNQILDSLPPHRRLTVAG